MKPEITRKSIYENCVVDLIDKKSASIDELNIELFNNVTMCISEKKKQMDLRKKETKYEITDIILWTMILFYCIDLLIGRR
jgi:hypothetical protein